MSKTYMSTEKMGKRLAELRKGLSLHTGEEWTLARVADELDIAINIIHRLEKYGSGSLANLGKLVEFYYDKGFNIEWVLLSDNSSVQMYREVKSCDQELLLAIKKLQEKLNNAFP